MIGFSASRSSVTSAPMRSVPFFSSTISSSPAALRKFTSWRGFTKFPFMRSRRSSPPALSTTALSIKAPPGRQIIASATVVVAASAACGTVCAFIHSKRFIALLTPTGNAAEDAEDGRWCHRQIAYAHADGVVYGICHCGGSRDRCWFRDATCIRRANGLVVFNQEHIDGGHLARTGKLVMLQVRIEHASALAIENAILVQREGDAHEGAAVDLALDLARIHWP